jgi:hypothetical protein
LTYRRVDEDAVREKRVGDGVDKKPNKTGKENWGTRNEKRVDTGSGFIEKLGKGSD